MALSKEKQMEMIALSFEMERMRGFASGSNLRELIAQGWRATYAELFGQSFVDILDSAETSDRHHSEAIEWHWESRLALLNGMRPPDDYFVNFPTWARGNLKTTLGRAMLVVDAMLSYAYGQGGYALIPGGTKKKIRGTAISLETMLHSPKVKQYCPLLSEVERNPYGHSKGWTADFIKTKANYVFHFIGLDEGVAGANVENIRPTFIMPDDIDSREDSPVISENRFHVFTSEILPARQQNTLVYWAQNLISRYSVRYRIEKQHSRVLTDRKLNEPVPAVRGLQTEQRTIGGIIKDVVVAGHPTWRGWNLQRVQDEINTYGLVTFLNECQHEVEQSKEGLVLHNYDDAVHVISESEFAAVYGSKDAWKEWYKVPFNDWARTKSANHANVAGYFAVSSQNTPLPGFTFCLPLSFPANQMPEDVAQRMLSILTPYAYGQTTWREVIQENFQRANGGQHFDTFEQQLAYQRAFLKNAIRQYSKPVLERYRVKTGAISHSEDKVRENYNEIFGFSFEPSNPKQTDSVEDIIRALKVDYTTAHPFRPAQKGYTRTLIIAPDDKTKEPRLEKQIAVYPPRPFPGAIRPDQLHDSDLLRYQFANVRWAEPKLTETGEQIDRLLKINDDFFQGWQMVFFKKLLKNITLTAFEKIELEIEAIQPQSKLEEAKAAGDDGYAAHMATHRARLEHEIREKIQKRTEVAKPSWDLIG